MAATSPDSYEYLVIPSGEKARLLRDKLRTLESDYLMSVEVPQLAGDEVNKEFGKKKRERLEDIKKTIIELESNIDDPMYPTP